MAVKKNRKMKMIGRTANGRIDFTESTENALLLQLAERGLHGELIATLTGLTRSQVYTRCHQLGVSLRDYRNGTSEAAIKMISDHKRIITLPRNKAVVRDALQAMEKRHIFWIENNPKK